MQGFDIDVYEVVGIIDALDGANGNGLGVLPSGIMGLAVEKGGRCLCNAGYGERVEALIPAVDTSHHHERHGQSDQAGLEMRAMPLDAKDRPKLAEPPLQGDV